MKGGLMKKRRSNPIPPEIQAEVDALAGLPEDQIDTEDIPEVGGWDDAKRGVFYRPIKQQITLRLDADLVDWFKNHHQQDEGYQTSINRALREYVSQQRS
jgi:uncharacterized protein (DUF4415 family)